jgi:hypothetical protein
MNMVSSKAFLFYLTKNIEYKYPYSEKFFEINAYGIQNYFLGKNAIFFDCL